MKRSWTALAVAAVAALAVAGCNDSGNTFQKQNRRHHLIDSPSVISAGGSGFCAHRERGIFVKGTVVEWNGKKPSTQHFDHSAGNILGNIITAKVPAALVANSGSPPSSREPRQGAAPMAFQSDPFVINPPPNPLPVLTGLSRRTPPL